MVDLNYQSILIKNMNYDWFRWDILMEILDAQKERISRIEIPAGVEATMMNDKDQDSSGNTATLH